MKGRYSMLKLKEIKIKKKLKSQLKENASKKKETMNEKERNEQRK